MLQDKTNPFCCRRDEILSLREHDSARLSNHFLSAMRSEITRINKSKVKKVSFLEIVTNCSITLIALILVMELVS